jgi:NAD/NADP transhydrogenase beta subunit
LVSGFAAIENRLFLKRARMIFVDARKTLQEIVSEVKAA